MKRLFGCLLLLAALLHAILAAVMIFGANTSTGGAASALFGAALAVFLFGSAAICTGFIAIALLDSSGRIAGFLIPKTIAPRGKQGVPYIPPEKRDSSSGDTYPSDSMVDVVPVKNRGDRPLVPVSARLTKIFVQMTNYDLDIYDDKILFDLIFTNHTKTRIRAFKGDLVFWDLFDTEIFRMGLTMNIPISAGRTAKWSGEFQYNQFVPEQIHLAGFNTADLRVSVDNIQIA